MIRIITSVLIAAMMIGNAAARIVAEEPYRLSTSGHIVVDVYVNGDGPFDFILDTGSTHSLLFESLRARLNVGFADEDPRNVISLSDRQERPAIAVESITFAGQTVRDLQTASLEDWRPASWRPDGILGLDVLGRFHMEIAASKKASSFWMHQSR